MYNLFNKRQDNIFTSFPKSGRTWIEVMCSYVLAKKLKVDIKDVVHKNKKYNDSLKSKKLNDLIFNHGPSKKKLSLYGEIEELCFEKTNQIFLFRDPRDILVSHYLYEKQQHKRFNGTFTDFVKHSPEITDTQHFRYGIRSIVNVFNGFLKEEGKFNKFMPIFYEDALINPEGMLRDIFSFLDISVDDDWIVDAVAYGSKKNMAKLEKDNTLEWYGLPGANKPEARKVRSGKKYSKENMYDETLKYFVDEYLSKNMNDKLNKYF